MNFVTLAQYAAGKRFVVSLVLRLPLSRLTQMHGWTRNAPFQAQRLRAMR